ASHTEIEQDAASNLEGIEQSEERAHFIERLAGKLILIEQLSRGCEGLLWLASELAQALKHLKGAIDLLLRIFTAHFAQETIDDIAGGTSTKVEIDIDLAK